MKHILTRPSRTIASVVGLRPGKRTFTSAHVRRPIVERLEDRRLLTTYFYESFESELGPEWTLVSVDAEARVAVRDLVAEEIVTNPISVEFSSGANSKALAFDSTQASGDSIKDLGLAILAVDLTGMTGGIMHFQHFKIGGSHDPLPDVHSTTAPGDGVSASRDGSTWYRLRTLTGNDLNRTGDGLWQVFKIDLGAEFQRINQQHQAGLQFDSQVQFKFSQYDSQPLPAQGWAIDEIRIQDQADSFTLDRPRGAFHRFVLSTEEERDYYYRAAVYGSPGPTTPILVTVHGTHGDIAYDGHPWRWQRFLGDRDEEIGSLIVVAPAFVETALLANGAVETLTISRDEGDIAYAITSGVQGRSVRLDHLQFTSLLSATSDAEGGFRVLGIPAGEYLVRLSLEDHEEGTLGPGQDDPTAIGPGVVMANVDFGLVAVDGEPPTVVSLIPSHGALEVAPDIELQIILSEPVQKGSGSIVVRTLADDSVVEVIDVSSPAVTVFQDTATILPGSLLALNTAYYVEIGAGAFTDLAGNGWDGFSGREAWIFATTIGSPPELVHTIADVTAAEDDPDTVIGLGPVFDDPDLPWGDQLTYTATVTMPIDSLVAQVSQSNYTAMHQNLLYTRLGDNRGFGPEHDLAQDNIYTYFVGLGLETALEPVPYQAQTYYNVVGVHAGVTRPGDVYLVGAHYDSVNNPGADDNGSGVAAVMELARVMTQYQFDATLVFVAFDREEQGLHGAYAYTAAHDTSKIQGMLSLDMIAYNPPGTHHNKVRFYDSNGVGQIKSDLATAFASYSGGLATVDSGRINASDHYPFERVGVDAALVIEYNVWSNPHYHKVTDAVETPDYIDYAYATKVTRGVMGYLATAAGLASASDLLTVTVDGEDLVLEHADDAHGIADIRVRATDSQGLYAEDTFRVTVSPVNDAPVLNPLGPMFLAPIPQDDSANPGTLVRDILAGGGPGTITDADCGALPGIAVTAVDNTHGTWQYTINNGRVWHTFGSPTPAEARLLGSDAGTRIRFLPAAGWYGSIDPGITFRAWDHSQGFSGQTVDASAGGDATAFSTALGTASITVDQIIATQIDMTIVHEPSATGDNGEVISLPASADWVHEWQSFWVEIWVSTPDSTEVGVAEAKVDLQYHTGFLTAQEIVYGPAWEHPEIEIDDQSNFVTLHGWTERIDVGDDAYVLLARVRFASTGEDQVPVVPEDGFLGPYDMAMKLEDGQTGLVGGSTLVLALGESPDTELWAVMYDFGSVEADIEENNQIDFGDFSFFAAAFGKFAGASYPPYTAWADFDRSGRIDFGDLAFFAPNFGKTRAAVQAGQQTLVFPSNFPDAWRAGAGGGGDAVGEGEWQGQLLDGGTTLEPVAGVNEDRVASGSPLFMMTERGERETRQGRLGLVDFPTGADAERLVHPAKLPAADPAGAVTDDALAWIAVEGTERWTNGNAQTRGSQSGRIEHNQRLPPSGSGWESLEEILSLLAEQTSSQLQDEVPHPHDALFSRIGR